MAKNKGKSGQIDVQPLTESLVFLMKRMGDICGKVYILMEDIYSDGFFCLLTTTVMALVSRLNTVCLVILEQELPLVKSALNI